ncbi:hypothetical protein CKO42_08500 [Lamprobacter modestohalophilus]|uniref:Uncharacterized protein n=1 Tax=Lamprobacter modestohalophilus TaxID=1064514 RepID=A0A9X0W7Z6_9GAMM|nr:hypothetical protein [Lamprobacter modestohalophilus]
MLSLCSANTYSGGHALYWLQTSSAALAQGELIQEHGLMVRIARTKTDISDVMLGCLLQRVYLQRSAA